MSYSERFRRAFLIGLLALFAAASSLALESGSRPKARIDAAYGRIPLSFEVNQGQAEPGVRFLSRSRGYSLLVKSAEAVFVLTRSESTSRPSAVRAAADPLPQRDTSIVRMEFLGTNPAASLQGLDEQTNKSNYFIGNDPKGWHTGVANYARVASRHLYPGIDLIYHGNQRQLEYDLVVAPGARADVVRIAFKGIKKLRLDASGGLILETRHGELRQEKPLVYQEVGGERRLVATDYLLQGRRRVGFRVGRHDATQPLVIDPVLSYSTYMGGSGEENGLGIAVDGEGNAYVTGTTSSVDFPTRGPLQPATAGDSDAFVAKIGSDGSLVYASYLGGSGTEVGYGIAVDSSGSAYLIGYTSSTDFPTQSPFQSASGGGNDAFVTKIDPSGSGLVFSTYLGGSGDEVGYGIAVDSSGSAYVTGSTTSGDFPTQNPFQPTNAGGGDAFVTKFDASGSALVYSSYRGTCVLPGCNSDTGFGIAVDGPGNAYLMRRTSNLALVCCQTFCGTIKCGICTKYCLRSTSHFFVDKVDAAGSAVVYSRGLAANGNDYGRGIAVDGVGNAYVTGGTTSTNLAAPVGGRFQPTNKGGQDAFVAKIDTAGSGLVYFSYLGGPGTDFGTGIAVDAAGDVYLTGQVSDTNLSIGNPFQPVHNGDDAFVARLNAAGDLVYFSYLGGSGTEVGNGIAVDNSGHAFIVGTTFSTDFPTAGPIQAASGSMPDAFVTKISTPSSPAAVGAASFFTLAPCRLLDTRRPIGELGGPALRAHFVRGFNPRGHCGIPSTAKALSVNVTVTETERDGDLRFFPVGNPIPAASTINYNASQTRANNAVLQLGTDGDLQVFSDQAAGTVGSQAAFTVQLIVDVNGYFE